MRRIIFLDADETLWSSHTAAAPALLQFLADVEQKTGFTAVTGDRQQFIHKVLEKLAERLGKTLRFDPGVLAHVLARHLRGAPLDTVLIDPNMPYPGLPTEEIVQKFQTNFLNKVPELREGVRETLEQLRNEGFTINILTETKLNRAEHIAVETGIRHFIGGIVSHEKTRGLYLYLAASLQPGDAMPLMVGDQTDKDIKYAREAGFITVYFPGNFNPSWAPSVSEAKPHYVISSFSEVLEIAKRTRDAAPFQKQPPLKRVPAL